MIRIFNYGSNAITNTQLAYQFNNLNPVIETWTGVLNPGDSVDYSFIQSYSPVNYAGNVTVCSYTLYSFDTDNQNDTLCEIKIFTGINENDKDAFWLGQNIPNPCESTTMIDFYIPKSDEVKFEVLNSMGELIHTTQFCLINGKHMIELKVSNYPPGMYFYSLEFNGNRITRKMVISR